MSKPLFGVKRDEVVVGRFHDNDNESFTEFVEVEFLNGRIYRSRWEKRPDMDKFWTCTWQHTPFDDNSVPMEEMEMEFAVTELSCHDYFDPAHQD